MPTIDHSSASVAPRRVLTKKANHTAEREQPLDTISQTREILDSYPVTPDGDGQRLIQNKGPKGQERPKVDGSGWKRWFPNFFSPSEKGALATSEPINVTPVLKTRHGSHEDQEMSPKPAFPETAVTIDRQRLLRCFQHVRQSADDQTIIESVRNLFELVNQHVANFYIHHPNQISRKPVDALNEFIPPPVSQMLDKSPHPDAVIKHCLLQRILQDIAIDQPDDGKALLPWEFLDIPNAVKKASNRNGAQKAKCEDEFLALWRLITFHLRSSMANDRTYVDERREVISKFVDKFKVAFAPWSNPEVSDEQRDNNLRELLEVASRTGILLFSQTSLFHFEWKQPESATSDFLVIYPRLFKVQDENAQIIKPAHLMFNGMVERIFPPNNHESQPSTKASTAPESCAAEGYVFGKASRPLNTSGKHSMSWDGLEVADGNRGTQPTRLSSRVEGQAGVSI